MGFLKSLFSSQPAQPLSSEQQEAEKKRVIFETLRDNGVRALKIREYKLAVDYLEKAFEFNKDSEVKNFLAEAYFGAAEMEKALVLLREIHADEPNNLKVLGMAAQAYLYLEKWNELLDTALLMEKTTQSSAMSCFFKGMAHRGLKAYDDAIEDFSKAINLAEDDAYTRFMRAQTFMELNKFDEAEDDVDNLIKRQMADDAVYLCKGKLRMNKEDWPNALDALSKAVEINPFNAEAYLLKAKILDMNGNTKSALSVCNEALSNMPENVDLLRERAALRVKAGDEAGSKDDIAKADEFAAKTEKKDAEQFIQLQNKVEDQRRNNNPFGL